MANDEINQDTHVLPAEIDKIFRRVQDSAHYMPDWQMEVYSPFFFLLNSNICSKSP